MSSYFQIQYLVSTPEDWPTQYAWQTCTPDICALWDNNYGVTMTIPVTSDIVNYAVNIITQYVVTPEPHNWRTQPLEVHSLGIK